MICKIEYNVIPKEWISKYRNVFIDWFKQLDNDALVNKHGLESFKMQSGIPLSYNPKPKGIFDFIPHLKKILPEGDWFALIDMASLRRQKPLQVERGLHWHQDLAVIAPYLQPEKIEGFVAWIPFNALFGFTPTLEVMPRWRWALKHHGNKNNGYLEANKSPNIPYFSRTKIIKDMNIGDILLFDLRVPHRTYITKEMNITRYSIDLRIVAQIPQYYKGNVIKI